jgi:hypothetical protein
MNFMLIRETQTFLVFNLKNLWGLISEVSLSDLTLEVHLKDLILEAVRLQVLWENKIYFFLRNLKNSRKEQFSNLKTFKVGFFPPETHRLNNQNKLIFKKSQKRCHKWDHDKDRDKKINVPKTRLLKICFFKVQVHLNKTTNTIWINQSRWLT